MLRSFACPLCEDHKNGYCIDGGIIELLVVIGALSRGDVVDVGGLVCVESTNGLSRGQARHGSLNLSTYDSADIAVLLSRTISAHDSEANKIRITNSGLQWDRSNVYPLRFLACSAPMLRSTQCYMECFSTALAGVNRIDGLRRTHA